jgi:hypothetical protein
VRRVTRRRMTMPTIVKPICVAALLLALGACSKLGLGQDAMTWARAALDRNERLEVVASDSQARTFTVRVKDSGQLVVIPLDEVVAGPAALMTAPARQAAVAPSPPAPAAEGAEPASPSPAPAGPPLEPAPPEAAPAPPAGPMPASRPAPPPPSSSTLVAADDQAAPPGQETGPHSESATNAKAGRVLASGPGYSIKASGSKAGPSRPSPATAAVGAPERLHDPIICQGSRLLHIDNRNLEFDGDAITAEDGCEIHITNTHISAKGIGVLARAANVHIKNSEIDGGSGAVDASDGAQVYAESSRFKGLTRRLESSAFHDLGGNVWN